MSNSICRQVRTPQRNPRSLRVAASLAVAAGVVASVVAGASSVSAVPLAPGSARTAPVSSAPSRTAPTVVQEAPTEGCTVSELLVPSCGAWWGVSPGGATDEAAKIADFETLTNKRTDMYRAYHRTGDMFPTLNERNIARDPSGHRILLESLRPTANGDTWAQVAQGSQDAYLKQLAAYIKANYSEKFLFVIHHEPENDVINRVGSGMNGTDYKDMYRHTVAVLRGEGLTNALFTPIFQGTQKFKTESWWSQMYPGDDVVDWLGWDSYTCVDPKPGKACNDFHGMINRRFSDRTPWQGMYHWATTNHPSKPIVVAEMGAYNTGDLRKANFFNAAATQVSDYPAIKAISYWNSGSSTRDTRITSGPGAVLAAATFANSPFFDGAIAP